MVTRNGRDRLVLLSAEEFKRLKRRAYFSNIYGEFENSNWLKERNLQQIR